MPLEDHLEIPIKCPKCSRVLKETLARLQRGVEYVCTCGARVRVQRDSLDELTRRLRKTIEEHALALEDDGGKP